MRSDLDVAFDERISPRTLSSPPDPISLPNLPLLPCRQPGSVQPAVSVKSALPAAGTPLPSGRCWWTKSCVEGHDSTHQKPSEKFLYVPPCFAYSSLFRTAWLTRRAGLENSSRKCSTPSLAPLLWRTCKLTSPSLPSAVPALNPALKKLPVLRLPVGGSESQTTNLSLPADQKPFWAAASEDLSRTERRLMKTKRHTVSSLKSFFLPAAHR